MYGVSIQSASHLIAIHLYLDVIPFTSLDGATSRSHRGFASIDTHFHTMLAVVPTTQVPPTVIVGILIIEHH